MRRASDVALFIDPFSRHFDGDALFTRDAPSVGGDIMAPYRALRDWFQARGVKVHTADRLVSGNLRAPLNVVMSFGLRDRYKALAGRDDVILSAFFAFESPVVEPSIYRDLPEVCAHFKRVFSFSDADALAPCLRGAVRLERFALPYGRDNVDDTLWQRDERRFLVMLNNNKMPALSWNELYTERLRALEFFSRANEVDLYGRGWEGPSFQMGLSGWPGTAQRAWRFALTQWQRLRPVPLLQAARRAYRGTTPSKLPKLSEYTFCLCYENLSLKGYITEKIFDCLVAGTIPIYLGAPDIETVVPADAFIDMRRFQSYDELRRFLKQLGPEDVRACRDAGRAVFDSAEFRPFTVAAFIRRLASIVEQDTGLPLPAAA